MHAHPAIERPSMIAVIGLVPEIRRGALPLEKDAMLGHGNLLQYGGTYRPIVSTTRNRAWPLIIRSYASATRSSGNGSFIDLTPVRALNASVSCESLATPEYQPLIDRRPSSRKSGETLSDGTAPITSMTPLTANPPSTALIASLLVAVARIALAPPSFCNSAAGSWD